MKNPAEDRSERIAAVTGAVRFQIRAVGVLIVAVNLLLPLLLLVVARVSGSEYWRLFDGEETAVDWISSVQLVLLAAVAALNYRAVVLLQRVDPQRRFRYPWVWLAFTAAFLLLAMDERFGWHEALQEAWSPARAVLLLTWVVGVATSYFLLGHLRRRPAALALYAGALVLALAGPVIGAFDESTRHDWPLWYFWDYSFEETAELWSQALFALSFLRLLHARVGAIGRAAVSRAGPGTLVEAAAQNPRPGSGFVNRYRSRSTRSI